MEKVEEDFWKRRGLKKKRIFEKSREFWRKIENFEEFWRKIENFGEKR